MIVTCTHWGGYPQLRLETEPASLRPLVRPISTKSATDNFQRNCSSDAVSNRQRGMWLGYSGTRFEPWCEPGVRNVSVFFSPHVVRESVSLF